MAWTLFLDPTRAPMYGAVCARTLEDAKQECLKRGAPNSIVTEYYLAQGHKTGTDFVKWLIQLDTAMKGEFIPPGFNFYVHSQNVEGRDEMNKLMQDHLQTKTENKIQSTCSHANIVWGNLSGGDFATHTYKNLMK